MIIHCNSVVVFGVFFFPLAFLGQYQFFRVDIGKYAF